MPGPRAAPVLPQRYHSYGSRGTLTRASAASLIQKALRNKLQAKRRATPSSNKKKIAANTRKLVRLNKKIDGPRQSLTSYWHDAMVHPLAVAPLFFQADNPQCGQTANANACGVYRIDDPNEGSFSQHGHFKQITDHHFLLHDNETVVNGPVMKLEHMFYQFKISSFCANTKVKIQFLRQKRYILPSYDPDNSKRIMPKLIASMCNTLKMDGPFATYEKNFEILQEKTIYMNAAGSNTTMANIGAALNNTSGNETVSDPTTSNVKYATFSIKFPKGHYKKQIVNSQGEDDGDEDTGMQNPQETGTPAHYGSWAWGNVNPLKTIWCVIHTDDTRSVSDVTEGQVVNVDIRRVITWRDPEGGGAKDAVTV